MAMFHVPILSSTFPMIPPASLNLQATSNQSLEWSDECNAGGWPHGMVVAKSLQNPWNMAHL
jgi:hypothetical protein